MKQLIACSTQKLTFDIYIFPWKKTLFKQPLTPSEIASFWTPSPPEFLLPFVGIMDIFWNYTLHLAKGSHR